MEAYRMPRADRRTEGLEKTPTVIAICGACVLVWVVLLAIQGKEPFPENSLGQWLAIRTDRFAPGSLLGSHLLHESLLHLALGIAAVAYAGRRLELRWGSLRFASFYLAAAVIGGLTVHAVGLLAGSSSGASPGPAVSFGASAAALACLSAYIMIAEDRPVAGFFTERYLLWSAMLAGAALLVLIERWSRLAHPPPPLLITPQLIGIAAGMGLAYPMSWWSRRAESGTARTPHRVPRKKIVDIRQRVDGLLEKIHREGIGSLSREERSFLRSASRHYKDCR